MVSDSGLITIIGGKWTTYRKMAEDTINAAIKIGGLLIKNCITKDLKIYGYTKEDSKNYLCIYGTDEENIRALIDKNSHLAKKLIAHLPYTIAEVIWAVKNEMARTVEDVLARRLRILFLDAKAAINVAPQVAAIVASELNYDKSWEDSQINSFVKLANDYLLSPYKTNRLAPSPVND